MAGARILIVEDEGIIAADIKESLQNIGYVVTSVALSGTEAINRVEENKPDLVLMDIMLQGEMDGIKAAGVIHDRFDIPVLYLTAYSNEQLQERAKITEPFGYIIKPFNERELHSNIEIALYKHKIDKRLKESEQWLSITLKSMGEAVIATDEKGIIKTMNPFAEDMTCWKSQDALGKPLAAVMNIRSEDTGESVEDPVTAVIREGIFHYAGDNTVLILKDGIKIPVEITGSLIKDDRDCAIGTVLIFNDITERKRTEEIRIENERLAHVSRAKSEFLASMSHELRTPLNAIIGFSELMKHKISGELNEKQNNHMEIILKSAEHLLNLINDILDLSKVEAGKVELEIERISVPDTIHDVLDILKEAALKRNVILKKEFDDQLDFIEADKQRIKQMLFNLLNNAVKFSKKEGGIVTITTKKEDGSAKISVSDTGIGIRKEDIGKLFREFQQLDSGTSRKYGGSGLGLAITKKLVELHGGKIMVESKYGEGSTFTLLLPLKQKENK